MAVYLAGGRALRINTEMRDIPSRLDAIIIGGGDDIDPALYGSEADSHTDIDYDRDKMEIDFIEKALVRRIPILGICRGAQLLNVVLGGNLHPDITQQRLLTRNRPSIIPSKWVQIDATAHMVGVFGRIRFRVNSLHKQAVDRLGKDLRVVGRDRDQIVQCIEEEGGLPIVGVQWHPEYLFYIPTQLNLFRWLVKQAR